MTTVSANDKPEVAPVFTHPFPLPNNHKAASMSEKELKQVSGIHALLTLSIDGDVSTIEESLLLLNDKLQRSNLGPLSFVACSVGAIPAMGRHLNIQDGSTHTPGWITKI